MKKLYTLIALAAVGLGFTSCEEDHDTPVYQEPTEFVLNTPIYANNTVYLAPGNTLEVTCSQPDYGYSAVTNYSLDMSLTEDFTTDADGNANYKTVSAKNKTLAKIDVPTADISTAVLELLGINTFEQFPEEGVAPTTVYVRALAQLNGVESSKIYSNTIKLVFVPFNPYSEGGKKIYICGINGKWGIDTATPETYEDRALTETEKGSNIYIGAFDVNPGDFSFRFYTELGSWGGDGELPSIGSGPKDFESVDLTMTGETLTIDGVPGKGNWNMKGWDGGWLTFTVDLNDETDIKITIRKGDFNPAGKAFIYLVGACSAWSVTESGAEDIYKPFKLYDWKGDGVYSGTFQVDADKATFRFYTELGAWGDDGALPSIGAGPNDANVDFNWADPFKGNCVPGKGNWNFAGWPGGLMDMTVDTNNMTVLFKAAE